MPTAVLLPHGKTVDIEGVKVIRSVSQQESDNFNERMARMPNNAGLISNRRWTVALEVPNARGGISTRYTSDVDVAELVGRLGPAGQNYDLIDGSNAAIAKDAKVHLIRPLQERADSANRAVIHVEGGSSNGLMVQATASDIHAELGAKAAGLKAIGDEGFINPERIVNISAFDESRELAEGQQRFTSAVKFEGVYRPQYFKADATTLTGKQVIDTRAEASRPAAKARPAQAARATKG